jgi:hypothetical protein
MLISTTSGPSAADQVPVALSLSITTMFTRREGVDSTSFSSDSYSCIVYILWLYETQRWKGSGEKALRAEILPSLRAFAVSLRAPLFPKGASVSPPVIPLLWQCYSLYGYRKYSKLLYGRFLAVSW